MCGPDVHRVGTKRFASVTKFILQRKMTDFIMHLFQLHQKALVQTSMASEAQQRAKQSLGRGESS